MPDRWMGIRNAIHIPDSISAIQSSINTTFNVVNKSIPNSKVMSRVTGLVPVCEQQTHDLHFKGYGCSKGGARGQGGLGRRPLRIQCAQLKSRHCAPEGFGLVGLFPIMNFETAEGVMGKSPVRQVPYKSIRALYLADTLTLASWSRNIAISWLCKLATMGEPSSTPCWLLCSLVILA